MKFDLPNKSKVTLLVFAWFSPLILVVVLNVVVDPLGVYGTGLFEIKPEFYKYTRQTKSAIVRRLAPEAVILGESASETGLNVESPFFKGYRTYNFALGAGNYIEMRAHLEHAYVQGNLRQVLIGLDFLEFCRDRDPISQFSIERLDRVGGPPANREFGSFLLSKTATVASLRSLQYRDPNFYDPKNLYPLHIYHSETGQRSARSNSREGHLNSLRSESFPRSLAIAVDRVRDSKSLGDGNRNLEAFKSMLVFCQEHSIECSVLIQPYHAAVLQAFEEADLMIDLESYKRKMLSLTSEYGVPLWDGFLVNSFTTNSDLEMDVESSAVYFWDTLHFKESLGEEILDRMSKRRSDEVVTLLSSRMLTEHLEGQRTLIDQFSAGAIQ